MTTQWGPGEASPNGSARVWPWTLDYGTPIVRGRPAGRCGCRLLLLRCAEARPCRRTFAPLICPHSGPLCRPAPAARPASGSRGCGSCRCGRCRMTAAPCWDGWTLARGGAPTRRPTCAGARALGQRGPGHALQSRLVSPRPCRVARPRPRPTSLPDRWITLRRTAASCCGRTTKATARPSASSCTPKCWPASLLTSPSCAPSCGGRWRTTAYGRSRCPRWGRGMCVCVCVAGWACMHGAAGRPRVRQCRLVPPSLPPAWCRSCCGG